MEQCITRGRKEIWGGDGNSFECGDGLTGLCVSELLKLCALSILYVYCTQVEKN